MLVCYTGGGTLGHIYPALSVHEELLGDRGYEAFWIGREEERERRAVERSGIAFIAIRSGKLRRYRSFSNILDIGNLFVAFFQAFAILARRRPDLLFSKGGYVSVPPVYAAALLGIPVISHESDCSAGLATRLNAWLSKRLCFGYSSASRAFPQHKVVVTGNPIRKALFESHASELSFLPKESKLILVLGGSQGSQIINALVRSALDVLTKHAFVYHQSGARDYKGREQENYREVAVIGDELGSLYRRATLVISRSGAGTISELACFGCAALLIPLSLQSSRGDQVENAKMLGTQGAARVLLEDVGPQEFLSVVTDLLGNEVEREAMKRAIGKLAFKDSAKRIADVLRAEEK